MEISSSNFRQFSAGLVLLSRIGKDILVEVEPAQTTFKALSDAKSSFGHVSFDVSFFSYYAPSSFSQLDSSATSTRNSSSSSSSSNDSSFKVSARVICSICRPSIMKGLSHVTLRSSQTTSHSSSSSSSSSDGGSRAHHTNNHELIIEIVMLSGVKRVHRITCQSADSITATYNSNDPGNSVLTSNPNVFTQVINHIGSSYEILIEASRNSFNIETYYNNINAGAISGNKDFLEKNNMSSGVSLRISEFESYAFHSECYAENDESSDAVGDSGYADLVVPIKEFKSFLHFSESLGVSEFELMFTRGGAPVRLSTSISSTIEVFIILASLLPPRSSGRGRNGRQADGDGDGGEDVHNNNSNNNNNNNNSDNNSNNNSNSNKKNRSGNSHDRRNGGDSNMAESGDFPNRAASASRNMSLEEDDDTGNLRSNYALHGDGDDNYEDNDNNDDNNNITNTNNDNTSTNTNHNDNSNDNGNDNNVFETVASQKVDFSNLINAYGIGSPSPNSNNNSNNNSSNNSSNNSNSNNNSNKRSIDTSTRTDSGASNTSTERTGTGTPQVHSFKRISHSKSAPSHDSDEGDF